MPSKNYKVSNQNNTKNQNITGLDKNSILVICAHSDDQIFGPGGTIAKYAQEGKSIHTIIFSYGEGSHPWFQKEYTIAARVKEALAVDKFIGGNGVVFLGLEEGKFKEQYAAKRVYQKIKTQILKYRPAIIFTHSIDEPLPDHRILNKIILESLDRMKYKGEVYMFDIWNLFNFKKRHYANIAVDISTTFNTKINALKLFKSQKVALFTLRWSVYFRAWINGWKHKMNYAEIFYKIR
jgi:LmbE family N-acetylglucosaminyl deacetylase